MRALSITLSSLMLSGCVAQSSIKPDTAGVAVSIYEPAILQSKDHCEDLSLVYFDKRFGMSTRSVSGKYRSRVTNSLYNAIKSRLQEVASIKTTTIRPDMSASAYHTMKVYVRDFSLESDNDGEYLSKTAISSIDIKLMKAGDACSVPSIEIEEVRQTPVYKERQIPSDNNMISQVSSAAAEDLIDQISPRRVDNYYRFLHTGSHTPAASVQLLTSRQCLLASKSLEQHRSNHPENANLLYNLGVAYECQATDAQHQSNSRTLLKKALQAFSRAQQLRPDDRYITQAFQQTVTAVQILSTASSHQKTSSKKIRDQFATDGSF